MKYDNIINIAIERSRKELNYVNKSMRYSDFLNTYLSNTKHKNESFEEYIKKSCDFGMCIYTTHKHTGEKPRFRVVIFRF